MYGSSVFTSCGLLAVLAHLILLVDSEVVTMTTHDQQRSLLRHPCEGRLSLLCCILAIRIKTDSAFGLASCLKEVTFLCT